MACSGNFFSNKIFLWILSKDAPAMSVGKRQKNNRRGGGGNRSSTGYVSRKGHKLLEYFNLTRKLIFFLMWCNFCVKFLDWSYFSKVHFLPLWPSSSTRSFQKSSVSSRSSSTSRMKNAVQGNSLIQGVSKVVVVLDPDSQEKKPDFEEDSSSVSIGNRQNN